MAKITIEELYENLREAYKKIVVDDHNNELDCSQYWLDIDDDGEMDWRPGWKRDAFLYEADDELQDVSEEDAVGWIEDCLNASRAEDFDALERRFFGEDE